MEVTVYEIFRSRTKEHSFVLLTDIGLKVVHKDLYDLIRKGYVYTNDSIRIYEDNNDTGIKFELLESNDIQDTNDILDPNDILESNDILKNNNIQEYKYLDYIYTKYNYLPFITDTLPYHKRTVDTLPYHKRTVQNENTKSVGNTTHYDLYGRILYKTRINSSNNRYYLFYIIQLQDRMIKAMLWKENFKYSSLQVNDTVILTKYRKNKRYVHTGHIEVNQFSELSHFDIDEVTIYEMVRSTSGSDGVSSTGGSDGVSSTGGSACGINGITRGNSGGTMNGSNSSGTMNGSNSSGTMNGSNSSGTMNGSNSSTDGTIRGGTRGKCCNTTGGTKNGTTNQGHTSCPLSCTPHDNLFVDISGLITYRSVLNRIKMNGYMDYYLLHVSGNRIMLFYNSDMDFYDIEAGNEIHIHNLRQMNRNGFVYYVSTIYTQFTYTLVMVMDEVCTSFLNETSVQKHACDSNMDDMRHKRMKYEDGGMNGEKDDMNGGMNGAVNGVNVKDGTNVDEKNDAYQNYDNTTGKNKEQKDVMKNETEVETVIKHKQEDNVLSEDSTDTPSLHLCRDDIKNVFQDSAITINLEVKLTDNKSTENESRNGSTENKTCTKNHESNDNKTCTKNHESNDNKTSTKNHESNDNKTCTKNHESNDNKTCTKNHESNDNKTCTKNHESNDNKTCTKNNESNDYSKSNGMKMNNQPTSIDNSDIQLVNVGHNNETNVKSTETSNNRTVMKYIENGYGFIPDPTLHDILPCNTSVNSTPPCNTSVNSTPPCNTSVNVNPFFVPKKIDISTLDMECDDLVINESKKFIVQGTVDSIEYVVDGSYVIRYIDSGIISEQTPIRIILENGYTFYIFNNFFSDTCPDDVLRLVHDDYTNMYGKPYIFTIHAFRATHAHVMYTVSHIASV